MEFQEFKLRQKTHIEEMSKSDHLFKVDICLDTLWDLYLDSFPEGSNEIYRERREYDCSCCRTFVRQFGNVVAINSQDELVTIWDFNVDGTIFEPVVNALSTAIKSQAVENVLVSKEKSFGTDKSRELFGETVVTWNHFYAELPQHLVYSGSREVNAEMANYRDSVTVLKRSLEEITKESVESVLDMIAEGNLYRGQEWEEVLTLFLSLQQEYKNTVHKDNWLWKKVVSISGAITRIRNHSIGVLLVDLSEGVDTIQAVSRYEAIVAPENYKRPKPVYTKAMLEAAEKTVVSLGLVDSLGREFATLEDISINDVHWADRNAKSVMGTRSPFEMLKDDIAVNPKTYERVSAIGIQEFMANVLPQATTVELLLENRHTNNMVSLIAPINKKSKPLFKWGNNFSWTYNGNLADASMKQRVEAAGGNVKGVLRFSLQWNTKGHKDKSDYDAHCVQPSQQTIYYANKLGRTGGILDVDIINPSNLPAVENISWSTTRNMEKGTYQFRVHCFSKRGSAGFEAEIEFDGKVYEFSYLKPLSQKQMVPVCDVYFGGKTFELKNSYVENKSSDKDLWALKTNRFHPVSTVMLSPNHWEEAKKVGNKHYFFMLADCLNPENPNGFYNEYLSNDLLEHKKVFAALGNRMTVKDSDNQLSGVGFSETKREFAILKIDGKIVKVVI